MNKCKDTHLDQFSEKCRVNPVKSHDPPNKVTETKTLTLPRAAVKVEPLEITFTGDKDEIGKYFFSTQYS